MGRVLLVTGMHRSGTSATAGALQRLGIYFGEPAELMPANPANPRGYFEHLEVVGIHDRLLRACGGSWDMPPTDRSATACSQATALLSGFLRTLYEDAASMGSVPGVKDPRASLFLPLWANAAERAGLQLHVLAVFRNGWEVARSLAQREGWPVSCGLKLREQYLDALDRGVQELLHRVPFTGLRYEELLCDWRKALSHTWAYHLGGRAGFYPAERANRVDEFLDPRLRHHA